MARLTHRFPTARDTGTGFALSIATPHGVVSGKSVREFLMTALRRIDEVGALEKLEIPFRTSGENYLLAHTPEHSAGRRFFTFEQYQPISRAASIYVNTNHPRFFGLRQGARLLEAAGIEVLGQL